MIITYEDGNIFCYFDYDEKLVALVKSLQGRSWDANKKGWRLFSVGVVEELKKKIMNRSDIRGMNSIVFYTDSYREYLFSNKDKDKEVKGVLFDYEDKKIKLSFTYDTEILEIVRGLGNRRWLADEKKWAIGLGCVSELEKKLKDKGITITYTKRYEERFNNKRELSNYDFLFPYQREGAEFLLNKHSALLGDEMGLGKSVTALILIKEEIKHNPDAKVLILCPLNLIQTWLVENDKFTQLNIRVVRGNKEKRKEMWQNGNIFITNYETVRSEETPRCWDIVVCDEVSRLKNSRTKTYQILEEYEIKKKIGLTGTPIENSVVDLYAILRFIDRNILPPFRIFREKFLITEKVRIGYGKVIDKIVGYKNVEELKKLIAPIFLRREKSEVMDYLPDLLKQEIWVKMSKKEEKRYLDYIAEADKKLAGGESAIGTQQLIRHLLAGVEEKYNELKEIANATEGQLIVFSEFVDVLKRGAEVVGNAAVVCGEVKEDEREKIIEDFKAGKVKTLFLQTKVGGYGLNLQNAQTIIFLNRPYNPAVEEQAISRAHRTGQKGSVQVYYLLADSLLEKRVNDILNSKKKVSDDIIATAVIEEKKQTR